MRESIIENLEITYPRVISRDLEIQGVAVNDLQILNLYIKPVKNLYIYPYIKPNKDVYKTYKHLYKTYESLYKRIKTCISVLKTYKNIYKLIQINIKPIKTYIFVMFCYEFPLPFSQNLTGCLPVAKTDGQASKQTHSLSDKVKDNRHLLLLKGSLQRDYIVSKKEYKGI